MHMILSGFRIRNYRSIANERLLLDDHTILIGKNNSGKSTVLDSIQDYFSLITENINYSGWFENRVRDWNEDYTITFHAEYELNESDRKQIRESFNTDIPSRIFPDNQPFGLLKHTISINSDGLAETRLQTKIDDGWLLLYEQDPTESAYRLTDFDRIRSNRVETVQTTDGVEIKGTVNKSGVRKVDILTSVPEQFSDLLHRFASQVRSIDAIRNPMSNAQVSERSLIQPDASDLAQVLQTYSQNNKEVFTEIVSKYKEIMEGVTDIRTPIWGTDNVSTTTVIDEEGIQEGFSLADISSGSKEILALITSILASQNSTNILLIEEPELHLHPEAERALLKLIQEVSKSGPQVILTTHSDVFVDSVNVNNIIRVKRDDNTNLKHVQQDNIPDELADLGYNKSNLLQSKGVVFVEGKSDERVLRQFGKKLNFDFNENGVIIVELDGEGNIASDGRSLIKLLYQMDIPYRFVLDSHGESAKKVQNDLLQKLNSRTGDWHTTPEHFIIWSVYGIESFLVEMPTAIQAATDGSLEEIERCVSENEDSEDKSTVLNHIFQQEFGEEYDKNHHGMMIAKQAPKEEIPSEVVKAIDDLQKMAEQ
ncbi:ATP-dependent nuclease [Haloferax volcanii]|uniref:ATP-dependent nuclease n=1 Tax=Haloferax volcanii TaxID=2246 RepID=UPI0038587792